MARIATIHALLLLALLASGCELVADFDRDKIPVERPDGGSSDAATPDAAASDDAAVTPDASEPPPDESDAGDEGDAGDDDAG